MQSFAPETLFYTLKEIGVADAGDLLSSRCPSRSGGCSISIAGTRTGPISDRMREWIEAMAEAGRKRMAEGLMELDMELVSLLLRQYIRVHRLDDPQDAADAPSDRFVQFDEHYLIEFTAHDAIHAHAPRFSRRGVRARLQLFRRA